MELKVKQWVEQGIHLFDQARYDFARVEFEKALRLDAENRVAKTYVEIINQMQKEQEEKK